MMYMPFILTLIAGIATLIGIIPIYIKVNNKDKIIATACAFASGVMFSLSVIDLIPEGIKEIGKINSELWTILVCFLFVFLGIFLAMILEKMTDKINNSSNLYKIGILSLIAIILHNIPEGIVTYMVTRKDIILGISLCMAIAIHNIPEGISIAIPIYFATGSKFRAFLYTFISAISEFMGAIIAYLFIGKYMNNFILGGIFLFTGGIMLALSYDKLLPTGIKYNKKIAILWFIGGIIFMIISLQLNSLIS